MMKNIAAALVMLALLAVGLYPAWPARHETYAMTAYRAARWAMSSDRPIPGPAARTYGRDRW